MIGSFWNLCRACPSMPVDKLHSEYRSTYRWHEYTGPRQEVVRRPPGFTERVHDIQPTVTSNKGHENEFNSDSVTKMEPAMPRRKKYPDLAHRHHDFILGNDGGNSFDNVDSRARSEERGGSQWRPSRRSKSEGPARCGVNENGIRERERERRRDSDPDVDIMGRSAGGDSGLLRKAISKISTEYRLQFAWPQGGHTSRRDAADSAPRKSQSMGALKANANAAMVHKKRIDMENKDASELEPLVNDKHDKSKDELFKTEYKKKFRPFSQYEYTNGHFTKRIPDEIVEVTKEKEVVNGEKDSWYREVVELRQKAGEYRNRGWGSKLGPEKITDMYNKQVELWDQVSRRSSLSALSLASTTHKNYTKEEKEEDNHKKSSPSKAYRNSENSARMIRDIIRHHLERTTGGSEKDGLILSPTREKLEPTIPRKDDDSRGSQKNSPKKNSPIKSSSLKRTNQKSGKAGPKKLRSQSVGPVTDSNIDKRSSPKRQSRSATVKERGSKPASQSVSATRKTRPSSLNTTVSSRSKNSSVKPEDDRSAKSQKGTIGSANQKQIQKGNHGAADRKVDSNAAKNGINDEEYDSLTYEPVVKSPPEPTRVKSPEQIIMRSPDPVNWTVPLDTGKTFTVTQNVKEELLGEIGSRPHSEVKAWTPPDVPPPVAQSAPPSLTDQNKEQGLDLAVKA